jgi:alpha-D-ribose 1-methylphosphonate 5-phosphate C-P lyase
MDRTYDIFEVVEFEAVWRKAVVGNEEAIRVLRQLAGETTNEVRLMHLLSNSTVAAVNTTPDSNT